MLLIVLDVRPLARNWLAGQGTVILSPRLKHERENEGQREPEQDRARTKFENVSSLAEAYRIAFPESTSGAKRSTSWAHPNTSLRK